MKKRDVKNILIFITIFIFLYFYINTLLPKYLHLEQIITSIFLIVITFISILLLGIRKTQNKILEKNTRNIMLYEMFVYFLLTYGIGIFIGFLSNSYSLKIISILQHIINPIIFIITTEILRYVIISANKDKKYPTILITIMIITLETFASINSYKIHTATGIFRLIASSILPLTAKHYMLSYLTYNEGFKNNIIFRLIYDLYIFIVPIFPNFGEAIESIVKILFIVILYCSIYKVVNERKYKEHEFPIEKFEWIDFAYTIVILFLVCLASGKMRYSIISIGSSSMSPTFNKGDAVVLDQKPKEEDIKKQDIIVFEIKGKLTIHRIIRVEKKNDKLYYYTKGDANNAEDNVELTYEDVKGKLLLIVPYAGYPNILIEDYR